MIKGIVKYYRENLYNNINLFTPICHYQYRKKTLPDILPYQERFDIKDGIYLVPKPPLKPLTAYNIFTLMYMKIIRENYPNEPTSVILKKLSSLWNDDEFMIDHKLEVLNLSKFQYDCYYNELIYYRKTYERPKEPLSPYQIYLKEHYTTVQEQLKSNDISVITSHITAGWHKLPEEEQQKYKQIFKDKFVLYKQKLQQYEETFRIPYQNSKNIYNLYLIDHFKDKKIKFNSPDEHQIYKRELQNAFSQLNPEERAIYEIKKSDQDEIINKQVEKFKKFFDISEKDYIDICKASKSFSKSKDQNSLLFGDE